MEERRENQQQKEQRGEKSTNSKTPPESHVTPQFARYKEYMTELTPAILDLFQKSDRRYILNVDWLGFEGTRRFMLGLIQFRRPSEPMSIFVVQLSPLTRGLRLIKEIRFWDEMAFIPREYTPYQNTSTMEAEGDPCIFGKEPKDLKDLPPQQEISCENDLYEPIYIRYSFGISDAGDEILIYRSIIPSINVTRERSAGDLNGICKLKDNDKPIDVQWLLPDSDTFLNGVEEQRVKIDSANRTATAEFERRRHADEIVYFSAEEPPANPKTVPRKIYTRQRLQTRKNRYYLHVTSFNYETGKCLTHRVDAEFPMDIDHCEVSYHKDYGWLLISRYNFWVFQLIFNENDDKLRITPVTEEELSIKPKNGLLHRSIKIVGGALEDHPLINMYPSRWYRDVFNLGGYTFSSHGFPGDAGKHCLQFLKHIGGNAWRPCRFVYPPLDGGGWWEPSFCAYPGSMCGVLSLVDRSKTHYLLTHRHFFLSIGDSLSLSDLAYKKFYEAYHCSPYFCEYIRAALNRQLYARYVGPRWIEGDYSRCSLYECESIFKKLTYNYDDDATTPGFPSQGVF